MSSGCAPLISTRHICSISGPTVRCSRRQLDLPRVYWIASFETNCWIPVDSIPSIERLRWVLTILVTISLTPSLNLSQTLSQDQISLEAVLESACQSLCVSRTWQRCFVEDAAWKLSDSIAERKKRSRIVSVWSHWSISAYVNEGNFPDFLSAVIRVSCFPIASYISIPASIVITRR